MSGESILRLCDVSFSYSPERQAVSRVCADIHAGERIAVLGPNGAGKSTLFLLLNGVLRPSEGSIRYLGKTITEKNINVLRRNVGIIFQDADSQMIAPGVREEISFGPMNLKLSREETARRVAYAISCMNLQGLEERPPHYLSGGEKKRVSIADIIAMEPAVFLFDEPAASLDCANEEKLEAVLDDLSGQGKTLLISTHDADFAWRWAQRVLVMQGGMVRADGTPPEIFAQEALCREANLKCPTLYRIKKMLEEHNLLKEKGRFPRTVEELKALLGER